MSPRHCGLFVITVEEEPQQRAPLRSINVQATTCGAIAHNTIRFLYKNTNNAAIQSKFIFPANSQSAIYHLSAVVGGRRIIGEVKEKETAQKNYDEAVASGKSAVLAKEATEASDVIELELGAFGPGEDAEVTIKEVFEMKLVKNGSQFQYKFPTSLFVRYGEDSITASASQNDAPTEYVLNFALNSHMGVSSIVPKPWLGKETNSSHFSFQENRKVFEKDHDVVLDLILATDFKGLKMVENWHDLTIIDTNDRKTDKMMTLSSIVVKVPSTPLSELPAKEYVFVVDCSGSMGGQRIKSAGNTLQQLINSLPVGSYFNIVRFGSTFESLFGKPREYNKQNKDLGMKLAETLSANLGGTELLNCLKSVLECKREIAKYKRQIFVLTDGEISNQDETLQLVKKHVDTNRVFSFGIGSGCSTALVNGLADAGMGAASFISDKSSFEWEKQENMSAVCIKSLMASASQHISKIQITPDPSAPREAITMVVDSTCLNVFHEGLPGCVTLELTLANNEEQHVVSKQDMDSIVTLESPFEPNVIHKLAAKKVIGEMVTANLAKPWDVSNKQTIIDLSVKEQVLSPYTALVGVADEATVVGVSQRVDIGGDSWEEECYSASYMSMPNYQQQGCIGNSYRSAPKKCSGGFGGFGFGMKMRSCPAPAPQKSSAPKKSLKKSLGSLFKGRKAKASITIDQCEDVMDDCMEELGCVDDCCVEELGCMKESKEDSDLEEELEQLEVRLEALDQPSKRSGSDLEKEKQSGSKQSDPGTVVTTYQSITNQQNPSGDWSEKLQSKHEETLFKAIESTSEDKKVQFTLYAILLLLVEFADQFDEWKLTAVKGVNFLKKFNSNLEHEISEVLSRSNLQFDDDVLSQLLD